MDTKTKLLEKLKFSPIALFDLKQEEINILEELIQAKLILKFIDNGSCNFPLSTLHSDAYYVKLF